MKLPRLGSVAGPALVLVGGSGTIPQALVKTAGAVGEVVDTSVGTGRARSQWLADHLKGGPVRLEGPAAAQLSEHLGELEDCVKFRSHLI